MHIVLSRIDSIGDVILTLPMAGLIRKHYPDARITFIGRSYTQPVVAMSTHVNEFLNMDDLEKLYVKEQIKEMRSLNADWFIHVFPNKKLARLVKRSGIPNRVGTSHRTFHWLTCNHRLNFSRKKSNLHEAQLNCKLLSPLKIDVPPLEDIFHYYGFRVKETGTEMVNSLLQRDKKNIILHPKSRGSAREWGLENFGKLIDLLPADRYTIFVSGTKAEAKLMKDFMVKYHTKIVDITGKFTLEEFITFIAKADALVAASTGPLHIAAALGKVAVGIYPPIRPMHPGRWQPLGPKTYVLVQNKICNDCRKLTTCLCMQQIEPSQIINVLEKI